VLNTFLCDKFDGSYGSYLKGDFSIDCMSSSHKLFELYALGMIALFPIGIPLMYYLLLKREKKYLNPHPGQDNMVNMRAVKYCVAVDGEGSERYYLKTVEIEEVMGGEAGEDWASREVRVVTEQRFVRYSEGGVVDMENGTLTVKSLDIDSVRDCNVNDQEIEELIALGGEVYSLDEEGAMVESLRRREEIEEEKKSIKRLSFLYESYEPNCWWFEVFESLRRLILTGGQVFLRPGTATQIVISIVISLGSMKVYSKYSPFVKDEHDWLAEVGQWQLFFTIFAALLMKMDVTTIDGYNVMAFDMMLCVLQLIGPALGAFQVLYGAGMKVKGKKVLKKKKGKGKGGSGSGEGIGEGLGMGEGGGGGGYDMDEVGLEMVSPFSSPFSEKYQGREMRAKSDGATGLGEEVESTEARRRRKDEEERGKKRMDGLKKSFGKVGQGEGRGRVKGKGKGWEGVEVAENEEEKWVGKEEEEKIESAKPKSEWDKIWDEKEGEFYYQNSRTYESSWDAPEGFYEASD